MASHSPVSHAHSLPLPPANAHNAPHSATTHNTQHTPPCKVASSEISLPVSQSLVHGRQARKKCSDPQSPRPPYFFFFQFSSIPTATLRPQDRFDRTNSTYTPPPQRTDNSAPVRFARLRLCAPPPSQSRRHTLEVQVADGAVSHRAELQEQKIVRCGRWKRRWKWRWKRKGKNAHADANALAAGDASCWTAGLG